ncbi:glycosyltransferase [Metapseudomonas resinovorans]|uniref:glycosyltransferase n=1 Tax=Metapseudomonas resinovorans TaxID=53412 RepID=UPI0004172D30|nr:glycosyltransferase [Pseudomonas resinovorans]
MQQPMLTVVVTSYNYSRYISRCVESILDQDFSDFELLILDNNSTDDTVEIVSEYLKDERVRLIQHEQNIGVCLNFSLAFQAGTGRYLSIVSADDCLLPGHFSRLVGSLQENPSCVLAYSPIMLMDAAGDLQGAQKHPGYAKTSYQGGRSEFVDLLAYDCYVTLCGVVFDREKIASDLYLNIDAWGGADWELFVRLALKYKDFAFEVAPGSCYRSHDSQYSRTNFYGSLEPLYTHLFILERYADELLRDHASAAANVAGYLRIRMAQYDSSVYAHIQQRLTSVLDKLEGTAAAGVPTDGNALMVVAVPSSGEAVVGDETWREISDTAGDTLFLNGCTHEGLASISEEVKGASCQHLLLAEPGFVPDMRQLVSAREHLDRNEDTAAICFTKGDWAGAHASFDWSIGAQAGAVLCRKSTFVKVGGYSPAMVLGGGLWDFLIKVLRSGYEVQARALPFDSRIDSVDSGLAWASVVFRNTECFASEEIIRAAGLLLESKDEWSNKVNEVLQLSPSCGSAHFMIQLGGKSAGQKSSSPYFSVVLTTFNRANLLRDALDSLAAQRFTDFEVILVNDNGEPVESILTGYDFPITYIRQGRNRGPAAARNAALRLARGEYVVYLDDDDLFLPNHLKELVQAIGTHPETVVYTDAVFITETIDGGRRIELAREQRYAHHGYSKERLLVNNYIPINTFACPRSLALAVGDFDESLAGLEDWDFLMRLAARTTFRHVRSETVEVRMRQVEPARRSEQALKDYPALYRELYSRHSDGGSVAVRAGRDEMLRRIGGLGTGVRLQDWLTKRSLTTVQQRLVEERLAHCGEGPSVGVVMLDLKGDKAALAATLASLNPSRLTYCNIQPLLLTVAQSAADGFCGRIVEISPDAWVMPLNQALQTADFDWLVLVNAGEELTPNGLLMACLELLTAPDCRAVYCDQMYRQANGDLGAAFRPAFNLDYLLSFPAGMAHHWLFRRDVLLEAGGFDAGLPRAVELDMILRLIGSGGLAGLGHIAEPLLITDAPAVFDIEDERVAILRHLQERGYEQPRIESSEPGQYCVYYGHSQQPMVSLLVLAGSHLARLQRCVESLLETTRYPHYELLLIESDPSAGEVRDWLKALEGMGEARLRTVWPAAAQLGVAAALNLAAGQAKGEYLLMLSPDTAVIDEQWLDELVNHAQRPEVGVVGGKLLAADGTIRHAGLILGLEGPVGRPFVGESPNAPGYLQRLQVDQDYSAVSRDCLMIARELYEALGGIAEDLPERYVDADICLRARQAGYLTVWAASAKLMLDADETPVASGDEQDAFYARWLPVLARDPAYNPNFSLAQPGGFKLADTALSWRPLSSWKPLPTVLAHPADQFGCGHYRVMQPFAALQQAGMVDGALSMGLMHVTDLERYAPDTIVLQRQIGDERLEAMRRMKAFSGAFKVYELDDYLLNLPMKSAHRQHMPKDILKSLRRGLGFVDRFVVSTEPLAEAFAGMHDDILVVENRLPVGWWQGLQGQRRVSAKPRVGWAGGSSHTGDLELIEDVVKALANQVEWVFFGMCPESMRPYVHEFHPGVAIEQYPAALARLNLDLALAPVELNLFNECKSNLRLLEYGACGFPVICSDIRCYQGDLPVTRVKNRFKDWVEAIHMHLADLDATARMGDELQTVVRRDWMLEGRNLELWLKGWTPGSL